MADRSVTTSMSKHLVAGDPTKLWPEPLDTPGYIPHHLKRSATALVPILEIVQRLLIRFRAGATGHDLEKLLALIGLFQVARPAYEQIKNFCMWAFTVQVTIPEDDPLAREILAWVGAKVLVNSHTRNAMLVTGGLKEEHDDFSRKWILNGPPGIVGTQKANKDVNCLPPIDRSRIFWVGFRPFLFSRVAGSSRSSSNKVGHSVNSDGQVQNSILLTTIGWNLKPLREFTKMCHLFKLENSTGTTSVFYATQRDAAHRESWQSVQKAIRKFDTIDMDETVKSDLIKDAEYYYTDESRKLFSDCGIPYRRGYLFYGPPGTGKSSFSAALAGHLQCNIYHVSLAGNGLSDSGLHRLFRNLPQKSIVVIEDIDSAGIGREGPAVEAPRIDPSLPPGVPIVPHPGQAQRGTMITLSGLLNAIDGNASQEGRLLIMTSNNPNALDPALTRPGRIDKIVHFGNMSKNAGESIFKRLIGRSAIAHDASVNMDQIGQYAKEFGSKMLENEFTPAQIQNYLQECRGDPVKAVTEFDEWIKKNRRPSAGEDSARAVQLEPTVNGVKIPVDNKSAESALKAEQKVEVAG